MNYRFKEFTGPDPPEWREYAFVTYFKDKLYYLGGKDLETGVDTNQVNVRLKMKTLKISNLEFGKWRMANRTCFSSSN